MAGNGRIAIAFGFIGLMLAALVWLLVSGGDSEPEAVPTTTQLTVAPTTSTSSAVTTTTAVADTTTSSVDPDARVAEVARILEDRWLGLYDAIYRGDEARLADLVAIQPLYDAAVDGMAGAIEFKRPPTVDTMTVTLIEILLDRPDCLVVHFNRDLSEVIVDGVPADGVQVLWPRDNGSYRLARTWTNPADLWQDDCDLMDRSDIP